MVPVQEATGRFLVDFSGQTANPGESLGPRADQVAPGLIVLLLGRLARLAKGLLKLVRVVLELHVEGLDPGRVVLIGAFQIGVAFASQLGHPGGILGVGLLAFALLFGFGFADPSAHRFVGLLDFAFPVLLGLALPPLEFGLDPILGLDEQLLRIFE